MEGSADDGLLRGVAGDRVVDKASHHVVMTDLEVRAKRLGEPTRAGFHVRRADHPLGVVLSLAGELDLATVPLLQEHLDRAMRSRAAVVIDLAGLGFIDSSGLGVLVRADRELRSSGGQLVLLGASRSVYRVFELAGLDRYFEWSDSPSAQTTVQHAREPGGVTRS